MKRITKLVFLIVIIALAFALMTACGSNVEATIYFNSNGGNEVAPVITSGTQSIKIPANPEKDGYEFKGWFWDNETFERPFTANSLMDAPIQSDMTVYAKWLPVTIEATTIVFNANGGSAVADITQDFDTTLTQPAMPLREGYTFAGWYTESELTTQFVFNKMPAQNKTLFAKWTPISYTITYNLDGGTNGANIASYTIESATTFVDATKDSYIFEGWYLEDTFATEITQITVGSTGNKTLFAKWIPLQVDIQGFSLLFDPVLEEFEIISSTITSGDVIIPAEHNGKPITKIGAGAFESTNIESITIPASIVSIGSNAFKNCSSLVAVNFAEEGNLYQINQEAFSGCTALAEITLPQSLVLTGTKIFFGCSSLVTVTVERPVNYETDWMGTHGAPEMFAACTKLATIYVYRENAGVPWWAENWEDLLVTNPGMMDGVMVYKQHPYWSDYSDIIVANPSEEPPVQE